MSDTLSSRPIYELKSSERLKIALEHLPPLPFNRPYFTEFDVLDTVTSKVVVTQWATDDFADKPAEGIGGFFPYFQHGIILPDGGILVGNNVLGWRMAVIEYHGGWFITILNGEGSRTPTFPVNAELWASMLGYIENPVMRSEALGKMVIDGVSGRSFKDLLLFVHGIHRRTVHRVTLNESSIVILST